MSIKRKIMKIINKNNTITIGKATNEILGLKHNIYAMPILDKDEKFGNMIDKLFEEINEVDEAYWDYMYHTQEYRTINLNKIINETLDVIQVAIGILDKASKIKNVRLHENFRNHMNKLINRRWNIKGTIYISKRKL